MSWQLPGYLVHHLIGIGACGQVWRAECAATGEPVALKRLAVADPVALAQARTEAALLRTLEHPHLVGVRELVCSGTEIVLVMDLADGGSLADLLARRQVLTVGEVVTVLTPIAAALAYAHHEGVLHNDVSAANILFDNDGKPLLADLGVARVLGAGGPAAATLAYLDPVVAAGGPSGPYTDVFALAAVGFHALTGSPPWTGDTALELTACAAQGAIPSLSDRIPGIPADLVAVIERGLAKEPHLRGTAAEFALDVRRAARALPVALGAGRLNPDAEAPQKTADGSQADDPPSGQLAGSPPGPSAVLARGQSRAASFAPPHLARTHIVRPADPLADTADRTATDRRPSKAASTTPRVRPASRHRARPTAPTARRPRGLVAIGAAVLVAALAGVVLARTATGSSSDAAGYTALASASVVADESSLGPAVPPAGSTALSEHTASEHRAEDHWAAVLTALDSIRETAYAQRRPELLASVYVPGPLLVQDSAQLQRTVPERCTVTGLRTTYSDLTIEQRTSTAAVVTVSASLAPALLTCDAVPSGRVQAQGPTRLRIEVIAQDDEYRIAGEWNLP